MKVDVINLSDIEFGDRRRSEYGDVEELAASISERGLIQPLAVEETPNSDLPYKLLAGGRRYMALTLAGKETVPVRVYPPGMSDLERRSIELAENFYRKDLTWEELALLQQEIHELNVEIHGEKISTATDAPGWSLKDTAALTGQSKSSTQRDVALGKALSQNPEAFDGCKSRTDALKRMEQIKEQMILDELARRAKAAPTTSSKQSLMDCFVVRDFFKGVKDYERGTFNFVEFDPPYAINLANMKKRESEAISNTDEYNEISFDEYPEFMKAALHECYRVLSDHSWMIVWFAPEPWFEKMYEWITGAGFTTSRLCGVWIKPSGQSKRPESALSNCYEMFFICRKGSPVLVKQGRSNVFQFNPVPPQKKIHPTERPTELIEEILNTFCSPGARVLVPCAGSGKTILAAHRCGMKAIGFDLVSLYKDRYILQVNSMEG